MDFTKTGTGSDVRRGLWRNSACLPVRDADFSLNTARGAIRTPMVVIRPAYGKMPLKQPHLSSNAILERDGFTCQYTGEKLTRAELNLDHVIPRDRGGKDTWDNMVACERKLNFKKGNKLNHEAGISLIRAPKAPKAMPLSFYLRDARHPHHRPFINR